MDVCDAGEKTHDTMDNYARLLLLSPTYSPKASAPTPSSALRPHPGYLSSPVSPAKPAESFAHTKGQGDTGKPGIQEGAYV